MTRLNGSHVFLSLWPPRNIRGTFNPLEVTLGGTGGETFNLFRLVREVQIPRMWPAASPYSVSVRPGISHGARTGIQVLGQYPTFPTFKHTVLQLQEQNLEKIPFCLSPFHPAESVAELSRELLHPRPNQGTTIENTFNNCNYRNQTPNMNKTED